MQVTSGFICYVCTSEIRGSVTFIGCLDCLKFVVGLSPGMAPVSQSCQGHLNSSSAVRADRTKMIRAERTSKTSLFVTNSALSRQAQGMLASSQQCFGGACPEFCLLLRGRVPFASAAHSVNESGFLHSPSPSDCCQTSALRHRPISQPICLIHQAQH